MNSPRYRKLCTRTWAGKPFRGLSPLPPSGQSLYLYLLLGPHTTAVPGLWVLGEAALAEAIGWPLDELRRYWAELEAAGLAEADWSARVVWVPPALEGNEPQSPCQVQGWRCHLEDVPDCPLKAKALDAIRARLAGRAALRDALAQLLQPLQESDPQTDPDTDPGTVPGTRNRSRSRSSISPPTPSQGVGEKECDFVTSEAKTPTPPAEGSDVGADALPEEKKAGPPPADVEAAARRVVAHFEGKVKPWRAAPGGVAAVLALLEGGRTETELRRCADGYAHACIRSNQDAAYRLNAGKFYGEGGYLDYLDWQPPPQRKPRRREELPPSIRNLPTLEDTLNGLMSTSRETPGPGRTAAHPSGEGPQTLGEVLGGLMGRN